MKKIITLILIASIYFGYGQSSEHIYALQVGHWDGSVWDFEEIKSVSMAVTYSGSYVYIKDAANSTYVTYSIVKQNDDYTKWMAIDEKGRDCHFYMYKKRPAIAVMYNKIAFQYFLD